MSSWMNVCLQLVERKLQLSGRDKSNAALVYIVPYWVHITASPSQHTLLYQVWSKIKPFESYLISVLVSAELLLGLKKYFLLKNFLLRIITQAQNFAGQGPAEPQAQEGQLLQLFTREGQSWRITRSICSTQKMTVKSGLKYQPCTILLCLNISWYRRLYFPGGFRQMPLLPLPPSSQDFPHPLVHR